MPGWRRGVGETLAWADAAAGSGDAVMFVDAPLVVRNEGGQRSCETHVGQRYGRWKVSARPTNLASPRLAGVRLLMLAESHGWRYSDGSEGPPAGGRFLSESFPYATLVGAPELGYDTERPRYKRQPPRVPIARWRPERAANCDALIGRLQPARGGRSAAAAAFTPGQPATGRRTIAARRRRLQAPRGPDRRPALRLDRGPVGAAWAGPLPGPRPASGSGQHSRAAQHISRAAQHISRAVQHTGRYDHRACPARAAPVIQPAGLGRGSGGHHAVDQVEHNQRTHALVIERAQRWVIAGVEEP